MFPYFSSQSFIWCLQRWADSAIKYILMPGERGNPSHCHPHPHQHSITPHPGRDAAEAAEDPAVICLSDGDRLLRGLPVQVVDGGRTFERDLPARWLFLYCLLITVLSYHLTRHNLSSVCPSQWTSDPQSTNLASLWHSSWSPSRVAGWWCHISKESWAPVQSPHSSCLSEFWSDWRPVSCPRRGGWYTSAGPRGGWRRGTRTEHSGFVPQHNSVSGPGSAVPSEADLRGSVYCVISPPPPPLPPTYNLYQAHTYIGFKSKTNFHKY